MANMQEMLNQISKHTLLNYEVKNILSMVDRPYSTNSKKHISSLDGNKKTQGMEFYAFVSIWIQRK